MKTKQSFKSTFLALTLGIVATIISQWLLEPAAKVSPFGLTYELPAATEEIRPDLHLMTAQTDPGQGIDAHVVFNH